MWYVDEILFFEDTLSKLFEVPARSKIFFETVDNIFRNDFKK